jgi:hypothetical protein
MAGSWAGQTSRYTSPFANRYQAFFALENTATADAANGTFPDWAFSGPAGLLMEVGVVFGTTGPDSLTVTITDADGLQVEESTITASGRIILADGARCLLHGGTVALSGNTTNEAEAKVILYFASNFA